MKKVKQNTISRKKQEGITLIALIVTIIVLLILAGVAISMLAGDNGILRKTVEAKEKSNNAATEEKIRLACMAALGTDGNIDVEKLNQELNNDGINVGVPKLPYTIVQGEKGFKINNNGEISEIENVLSISDLKGTTWQFNENLTDISMFAKYPGNGPFFDFGYSVLKTKEYTNNNVSGLVRGEILGVEGLVLYGAGSYWQCSVAWVPDVKSMNLKHGWYAISSNNKMVPIEEIDQVIDTSNLEKYYIDPPMMYFENEGPDSTNTDLINWMKDNATLIGIE